MTITTGIDEGLRARKRAATQLSIERTAIALALEHGYEHITVEMICEAAMVSPRTFFNYFGSKEGVILGSTPPLPTDDEIQKFVHGSGSNVLGDLVEAITAALVDHEPDTELLRSRRSVIMRTPELTNKEIARLGEIEDQLVRMVLARFEAQGRDERSTPGLEDEARIIVALAGGVIHYAMRKWFGNKFAGTLRELLDSSIELIRRVTK